MNPVPDSDNRRVSVIVPTRDSAEVIERCVRSVLSQSRPPDEVIICDGGSSDGTQDVARSLGAVVVDNPPNRSAQRNRGAEEATGTHLLFIDSDMRLTPDVIAQCLVAMGDGVAAAVIPEIFVGDGFWAGVRGHERTFYDGVWWIEAARFFRADAFDAVGGFDAEMIGPEDWDLDQRIRAHGSVARIRAHIDHDEGRTSARRLLTKKAHYAGSMEQFRQRHPDRAAFALSPVERAKLFARHPLRLAARPIATIGLIGLGLAEVAIARGWTKAWDVESPERAATAP